MRLGVSEFDTYFLFQGRRYAKGERLFLNHSGASVLGKFKGTELVLRVFSEFSLSDRNAYIRVTVDGKTTEMHDGQSLKVGLAKSAKQATVRVAASARKTVAYTIGRLNSVQRNGMLQVSLDIGNGLAGTRLSLDLVDMQGHLVRTVSARATEGLNTLQMALPRSGVYVLRARAGGQAKTGKVLVK